MPPINLYELGFDKVYIKIINSFHVVLDGTLFGREREEQLMKASHVFPCLGRSVL